MFVLKLNLANRSISKCLEIAATKKEFIYTTTHQRVLGKTKALIEFAKENGYTVLLHNTHLIRYCEREYNYKNIRSIASHTLDDLGPFVFDEGCERERINELIELGYPIITGFVVERR